MISMEKVKGLIKALVNNEFWKVCEVEEVNEIKRVNGHSEVKEEIESIENKLNQILSEEQRELLTKYSDLNSSLVSMEQEYYFKKGVISGLENKEALEFLDPTSIESILI